MHNCMNLYLPLCFRRARIRGEAVRDGRKVTLMPTKSKKKKRNSAGSPDRAVAIPGLYGVRVLTINGETRLELRHKLGMAREVFGRLVNVSVRTIAEVESNRKKVDKLQRNYVEVNRLCDSLSEVVDPSRLGDWFNTPNDAFAGLKPLEVIERGEIDRLWEMFFRLRSGLPG